MNPLEAVLLEEWECERASLLRWLAASIDMMRQLLPSPGNLTASCLVSYDVGQAVGELCSLDHDHQVLFPDYIPVSLSADLDALYARAVARGEEAREASE